MNNRLSVRLILIFGVLAISVRLYPPGGGGSHRDCLYRMALPRFDGALGRLRPAGMKSTPIPWGVLALRFFLPSILPCGTRPCFTPASPAPSAGHNPARVCHRLRGPALGESLQAGPGLVCSGLTGSAVVAFAGMGLPASRATSWPWGER